MAGELPFAGAPTPPLLDSLAQDHECHLLILMLLVAVFPYFSGLSLFIVDRNVNLPS